MDTRSGVQEESNTLFGTNHVVPGIFVEVLWDLEKVNDNGRLRGKRQMETVWWRAEVISIERSMGRLKAQIRYDGRDGFDEQTGDVWVFPRHIRIVGDDSTQLRWRFYECSGEISYGSDDEGGRNGYEHTSSGVQKIDSCAIQELQVKLGNLIRHYEALERVVVAQNHLYTRLLGTGSAGDRQCAQLFSALRQKIAVFMQKPIPPLKASREVRERGSYFEENCAGSFTADVDCEFQLFQAVARVISSKVEKACYRPSFGAIQCSTRSLDRAEIALNSFSDLTKVLEITSNSDVMHMASRRKENRKQRETTGLDVAVRLIGTCLIDTNDVNSAMAILICNSIHEECLSCSVDSFIRETREFDFTSRAYRTRLLPRTCTGESLIRTVFSSHLRDKTASEQLNSVKLISSELPQFALRWHHIAPLNSRTWSRSIAISDFVNGILEVEIPFLLFRGPDSVDEVMGLVTDSFLRKQIGGATHSIGAGVINKEVYMA